jgi:superfamily II DNA or RNA helicase
VGAEPYGLRWYQREAKAAIEDALGHARSTLCVMATGTGKTRLATAVAGDWNGRVLALAHRAELVEQLASTLAHWTKEPIGLEHGGSFFGRERIVVGSTQTCYQPARLERLARAGFTLIIPDETHRYLAPSFRKVLDAMPEAKVLGITATPNRHDKQGLGAIMETVAYRFGISEAIEAGVLVPPEAHNVPLEAVDLTGVDVVAGDLKQAQLEAIMVTAVAGIVDATLAQYSDKQGVVFLPGKKAAMLAAERFNELKPGSAACVTSDTPPDEREAIVRAVRRGDVQYFTNCDVATEGFDWPEATVFLNGSPTRSVLKYTQRAGRVLRPLAGVIDGIDGADGAEARKAAIAASPKPLAILANFVGKRGRHRLATPTDLLGSEANTDEERELAEEMAQKQAKSSPADCLKLAQAAIAQRAEQARIAALAKAMRSKTRYRVEIYDPFGLEHGSQSGVNMPGRNVRTATPAQLAYLRDLGYPLDRYKTEPSFNQARGMIESAKQRQATGKITLRQIAILERYNPSPDMSAKQAGDAIHYLRQCSARGRQPDQAIIDKMIVRKAE